MKTNFRVSVNGWSTGYASKDMAMDAAQNAMNIDNDSDIKVFDRFNNVIWEN